MTDDARETATTASRPSLDVVRQAPFTVRGQGFRANESVSVSAAGRRWRADARSDGTFVLALTGADPCRILLVLATGSTGSRTTLRILPTGCAEPGIR